VPYDAQTDVYATDLKSSRAHLRTSSRHDISTLVH